MGRGDNENQLEQPLVRPTEVARQTVQRNHFRIAQLGNWPAYIDSAQSLLSRIPSDKPATGFDAGIACALDMIPRSAQRLSAILHAAYTPQAVQQVRQEAERMDPDSETCWWLAACSVCEEGRLDSQQFAAQLAQFSKLALDPAARQQAARRTFKQMTSSYQMRDGLAYTEVDGGMQGAYLDGHQMAVMHAAEEDLYFVGTYQPSLGLEQFKFSDEIDDLGRPRSGAVHGSKQFVRFGSYQELQSALPLIKAQLQ